jgi:hypothetical protein
VSIERGAQRCDNLSRIAVAGEGLLAFEPFVDKRKKNSGGTSMPIATPRVLACCCIAVLAAGIAGCSSSSKKSGEFASTLPSTASTLTKAEFVSKMNAICTAIDTQRKALPTPSGPTDYLAIAANLSGTLRILPSFIAQADQLVTRSPDRDSLNRNWLSIEKSDFATIKPIAERMVVDSNAKDSAKVSADGEALSSAPDHSSTIATFMTGYGLTSCASLEQS